MPDDDPCSLTIGEVRYGVFNNPDNDMPWLGRFRLVSLSRKGRRATWELVNGTAPPERFSSSKAFHPHADPVAAIEEYQRKAAFKDYDWDDRRALDLAVHRIVAAEKMKDVAREALAARRERDAMLARLAAADGG